MKLTLTQKGTRLVAAATAEDIIESDPNTVTSGEIKRRMMKIQRARSAIMPSWNRSAEPSNRPCATRTRKIKTKNRMLVPL